MERKMALILCLDCGREVSTAAKQCPNCGCPTEALTDETARKVAGARALRDSGLRRTEQETAELLEALTRELDRSTKLLRQARAVGDFSEAEELQSVVDAYPEAKRFLLARDENHRKWRYAAVIASEIRIRCGEGSPLYAPALAEAKRINDALGPVYESLSQEARDLVDEVLAADDDYTEEYIDDDD